MTPADYAGILIPVMGSVLAGALYVGRKLESLSHLGKDLDGLKAERLPERVAVLESVAGVR